MMRILFLSLTLLLVSYAPGPASGFRGHGTDLRFFIVSDWGWNGGKSQQVVADQMAKSAEALEPSFIISCGDNFQVQGVASTADPLWLTNFEYVYKDPALQVDWFPVLGNHDYKGNTQAQIDYSKISRRWRLEAHYYTFVRKIHDSISARFIFLDTPPFVSDYYRKEGFPDIVKQDTTAQLAWLRRTLAESHEQWKLVFGHHPVYSYGKVHGNTPELVDRLKPLLEKYHAQIYFSGHDHDLQHLRNGPVDYIVTGTGGEPRPSGSGPLSLFNASTPAFSSISMFADSIQVNFVDYKGNTIYTTSRSYR